MFLPGNPSKTEEEYYASGESWPWLRGENIYEATKHPQLAALLYQVPAGWCMLSLAFSNLLTKG